MYKFIKNNNVIDVVEKPKYYTYLENSKKFVVSDSKTGNFVQGSDKRKVYALQGTRFPASLNHDVITIKKIDKFEFTELKKLLTENKEVCADTYALAKAREDKIKELKQECAETIKEGIIVKLSDNQFHEFELTIEDQLNLNILKTKLDNGAEQLLYHEKGCTCKLYDRVDIEKIILAANKHIEYNTTYFNLMRHCINNVNNIDLINAIIYGDNLLLPEYDRLLQSL